MQHPEKEPSPSKLHNANANPRSLHSKRSLGLRTTPHALPDSPAAYDASEEDNDPLTDSGASAISVSDLPSSGRRAAGGLGSSGRVKGGGSGITGIAARHALAREIVSSDEALDSPTYDGDIESSTTAGPDPVSSTHYSSIRHNNHTHTHGHHHQQNASTASIASTLSPSSPPAPTLVHSTMPMHSHVSNAMGTSTNRTWQNSSPPSLLRPTPSQPSRPTEPSPATQLPGCSAPLAFDPAKLTPEDIQAWFKEVIDGPGCKVHDQWYKINPPPKDRPVRIYADGEYSVRVSYI
ncbi:hypothetical protein BDY19DRAFT_237765 [Irpex rosettiformis]|uniref:Uncharacterized protein n=1 Tax=Irpex rosettiformis TaxID=378272 RepID=A0ACB8U0A0_9APHY|nr:hypothetical protein BDY19DRAFT_237765 [Irpex rosettiformis]